ncbi:MAG: hypothetical protein QNK05_22930 [Myxococcota bacterium]|nr:hypothetical protein [Myxococcota bacterium]
MNLSAALEAAAEALPEEADQIWPANGDPTRLLELLLGDGKPGAAERVLGWLLAEQPDAAGKLADAWAAADEGAAILLAVDEAGLAKPARKVMRRVRHRLRASGVTVPETRRTGVASLPKVDDDFSGAFLSSIDPVGARMAYLVEPNPGGGARLYEIVIDDARGIVGFEEYTAPRKKARAFLDRLRVGDRLSMLPVEEAQIHAVLGFAEARQDPTRPAPRGFLEARGRLLAQADSPLPGQTVREVLGDPPESEREAGAEAAAALVREGRLGPWPVGNEPLTAALDRIRESLESDLIVSGATRDERIADLLGESAAEIYDEAGCALAAHRLRESAYVFWKNEDEESARACLGAALRFEAGEVSSNPLARAFLEASLGPAIRALEAPDPGAADEAAPDEEEVQLVKPVSR